MARASMRQQQPDLQGKGIDDIKGKVDDVECKGKGKGIHEAAAA